MNEVDLYIRKWEHKLSEKNNMNTWFNIYKKNQVCVRMYGGYKPLLETQVIKTMTFKIFSVIRFNLYFGGNFTSTNLGIRSI